jgi:aspartyl-tRNA(Asn)/glutamyl-tRNA(Gln) amidotransferase subunit A
MARTVEDCEAAMGVLAPGFRPLRLESLEEVRVGIGWTEAADPLVRARVEAAAQRFPRRTSIDLPSTEGTYDEFMREVADVHRELFAEHADAYGENVRPKIERCLAVTDAAADAARRFRAEVRERYLEAAQEVDLLLTPTIPFVAPPDDADESAFRARGISLTYPFDCVGWPALALPCGPAEEGLPASLQLVGKPGEDALVLAAGASLDRGTATA